LIFLDTNVVSELLRPRPDATVLAWSYSVPREQICVASVVEAELRAGIERLPDGRRKRAAERDLDLYFGTTLGGRVFPLDRAAARLYAAFKVAREKVGRPTAIPDALIAATARAHGATLLATRNTRDFEGCGVALLNPWDGP
jgi:predicted nucleic acid-binding protein